MIKLDEKYTDDVQKLLDLGKDKAFLTYDDINQELPEGLVSPDDIEDIFATLNGEGISISDTDEKFLETAAAGAGDRRDPRAPARACGSRAAVPAWHRAVGPRPCPRPKAA